jgi:hypothetical protein
MRLVTCRNPSGDTVAVLDGDDVIALRDLVPEAPGEMIDVIAAGEPLRARLTAALRSRRRRRGGRSARSSCDRRSRGRARSSAWA